MPKRKKYPRLPNGYGNIRYLGKGRANPYAVHPPAAECDAHGNYLRPKALCYVDDWYVGFAVLNAYHAGTYKPGDEMLFKSYRSVSSADLDIFCQRILTDFSAGQYVKKEEEKGKPTFAQIYDLFYDSKYGSKAKKKLSKSSADSTNAAYKNCSELHDRPFCDITLDELQDVLDNCPLKKSSLELIKSLFNQMYSYALPRELCQNDLSRFVIMPDADGDEHGVPFSGSELASLWHHKNDPVVEMLLIMCYSGYRISAYTNMEVNLDELYFYGGVKSKKVIHRYVPIHPAILPLVQARMERYGKLLPYTPYTFRQNMYSILDSIGIHDHTPHDTRHTFSTLCERYHVSENDRKRMMGHSFGTDITNRVYGHRSIDDLRFEIEKIEVPYL